MSIATVLILFMVIILIYIALISMFTLFFRLTGLTRSKAFFQTISLLMAVGYTTSESEAITSNPTRRKLALSCMIIGNLLSLVIVSLIIDTIATFDINVIKNSEVILLIAFAIFISIFVLFNVPFIKNKAEKLVNFIGYKLIIKKHGGNIVTILDNYGVECIAEVVLNNVPSILVDKSLAQSNIKNQYQINIMAVRRNGRPVNLNANTHLQSKDVIIVYGNLENIKELFTKTQIKNEILVNDLKNNLANTIYVLENFGNKSMIEVEIHKLPEFLNSKTIFESKIKDLYEINVILIKRDNVFLEINKDTIIQDGDKIVLFGPYDKVKLAFSNT